MSNTRKPAALPRSAYAALFGRTREAAPVPPSGSRAVYGFRRDVMGPL